jgi:hypothetical protein
LHVTTARRTAHHDCRLSSANAMSPHLKIASIPQTDQAALAGPPPTAAEPSTTVSAKPETSPNATPQVLDQRPAPTFLRLSAGFVYFYFGFLKFFPDLSPAELLAAQTVMKLTNYWMDAATALWWLSIMECGIGLCFLFNFGMKYMFFVFLAHQASTFLPLFMYPEITFKIAPFAPTMEGQYIFKNLISVAAGWTVMLPAVKDGWRRKPVVPATA